MDESRKPHKLEVNRIVVALDASSDSLAALRSAATMAAALEAELVGLYVEDENLLRLAGLPFAREMQRATGRVRVINPPDIEKDFQLQAARARRALAEIARQAEARWRFEVVRGRVAQEILKASLEADLLSLGRTSRPLFRRMNLGSTAREAIFHSAHSVFLALSGPETNGPIFVLYDGSTNGLRALVTAWNIAQINETGLTVLLPADGGEEGETPAGLAAHVEEFAKEMAEALGGEAQEVDVQKLPAGLEPELVQRVNEADCRLLVLGMGGPVLEEISLEALFATLTCPVMLVK